MKKSPFFFVFTLLGFGCFFYGFTIRIIEGPLARNREINDFSDVGNCIWASIVTMTTGILIS